MPRARLTKRFLDSLKPGPARVIWWDEALTGFGVKVQPSGALDFFCYYRLPNGQQRRPDIGRFGALTVEEARAKARKILLQAKDGQDPMAAKRAERGALTLAEFAERYLADYARVHKKARSVHDDEGYLARHILPALGNKKVKDISRADVLRLQKQLTGKAVTANRVLACLSKMMNLAELWEVRPDGSNPCRHVKRFREKPRKRFLSPDEMARLAGALNDAEKQQTDSIAAINFFRLLLLTGMRSGEVRSLRWEDVDLVNRRANLRDSKTGPKAVVLNAAAIEVLERMPHDPSGWVCPGRRKGQALTNPAKPWERICKAAKLENLNLHDLRHAFGSVAAEVIGQAVREMMTGARVVDVTPQERKSAAGEV